MRHYNFVIFGSSWDLYKQAYSDLYSFDDVVYIEDTILMSNRLRRIHLSKKINSFFNLPYKRLWNKYILEFDNKLVNEHPICFLFFSNWAEYESTLKFTEYLKKTYKGAKCVLFLQDLYKYRKIDISKYDLVLSFDKADCKKYGFIYHPLVFSDVKFYKGTQIESDIYFLGKAKNRLSEIIKVYEFLIDMNLKCEFYLVGVNKENQVNSDTIHYIENMDYISNLNHIRNSKCLLEIMQESGTGFTQRGCEAVCLGKKLLTNNQYINDEPFFNPKYISIFKETEDIDREFVKHISDNEIVDYHYKEKMSPIELLEFIEKRL